MADPGKEDASTAPVTAELQFDRLEPAAPGVGAEKAVAAGAAAGPLVDCQVCHRAVETYYELRGAVVCSGCHDKAQAEWHRGSPGSRLLRALAFGLAAGLAGCVAYYAVLKLTGYEFGLIAILVGYGVGFGVRSGSGGRGGRGYQVLAVAITYLSIVLSYVPLVVEEFYNISEKEKVAVTAALPESGTAAPVEAGAAPAAPAALPAAEEAAPQGVALVAAFVVMIGMILVMPFLAGFENILGLLIIFFGLWEAWRLNTPQVFQSSGPFTTVASSP